MNIQLGLYLWLERHRFPVIILACCLVFFAVVQLFTMRMSGSSVVFLPDSDAEMRLTAELLESAPISNMLFIDLEGDDTKALLAAAELIEQAVSTHLAKPVRVNISSLAPEKMFEAFPSFFSSSMEKRLDAMLVDGAMEDLFRQNRQLLSGMGGMFAASWIRGDPLQLRQLLQEHFPQTHFPVLSSSTTASYPVSHDNRHVLLMLRPCGSALDTVLSQKLIQTIRNATQSLEGITVHISGGPRHVAANAKAIESDIQRIAFFSLAGFSLAYFFLARSWGAVWILLTPVVATAVAAALTSCVWPVTSGLVLGFGMSLMGLAEDYAVHMHFALRSGTDKKNIYTSLLPPLFHGFLLNISGFSVLLFSSMPAIRQMAFFSCCSLTAGFCLAIFVLPFLPWFTQPCNIQLIINNMMNKHSVLYSKCFYICMILLILCGFLLIQIDTDFSPYALGADTQAITVDANLIRNIWQIDTGTTIALMAKSREDVLLMSRLCAEKLRKAGLKGVRAPSDLLPLASETCKNSMRWKQWLKRNKETLRHKLEIAAQHEGFLPAAFLPFWKSIERPVQSLSVDSPLITELGFNDMADMIFFDRAEKGSCAFVSCQATTTETIAALGALLPEEWQGQFCLVSPGMLENSFTQFFRKEKMLLCWAGGLAWFLLFLLLRRPSRACVAFIPSLLSLTVALIVFWGAGIPLTIASLAALPIVLGLALDHGIMITHALEYGQELGIRKAVVLSSLTAFLSMGLLAFSEHPALRSMGLVIFSGLAAELAATLWLIPLMYVNVEKDR